MGGGLVSFCCGFDSVLEGGFYLICMVGKVVVVDLWVRRRKMWDGLVVGLCCDCCSGGGWCLIADWTLGSTLR